MKANYAECLRRVLVHEGGRVNHPKDPGGATNQGVTQRVYDAYRLNRGQAKRHVFVMTDAERDAIYREQYWDVIRGDDLPSGLDYAVFDFAVNSGCVRAAKALQSALKVKADGVIGNVTLQAARRINDRKDLVSRICLARLSWLQNLTSLWKVFGRGWRKRVVAVRETAMAMA
jgi:lysozyme family protein